MSGKITNLKSGKCKYSRVERMPRESAVLADPLGYQVLCPEHPDCNYSSIAQIERLLLQKVSVTNHLELSSMPTAILGNFPEPEVSKDLLLKPSSKDNCQINTAEHQSVATYSLTLYVLNQYYHLKLILELAQHFCFPLAHSAFIPFRS